MRGRDDRIPRRAALLRLAGLSGGFFATNRAVAGQGACLEGQTIGWLVGYSPGGGYDAYARLIEPFLEEALGARVVVRNLPGAAGAVALRTLADARPDGRTLGIFDGPGALWASASSERDAPDPERDLTLLGRVACLQHTLVTGPRSGVKTVAGLVESGRRRRLVFGATSTASQNFVSCAVVGHLLGIDADFVVGYPGSRELTLALVRGDFDAMSISIESVVDVLGADRLTPLLLATSRPLSHPELDAVPRLRGESGLLRQRPDLFDADPAEADGLAAAIETYLDFGRVIAAPARLAAPLRRCLEQGVIAALRDPALEAAAQRAGRTLDIADASRVRASVAAARAAVARIVPIAAEAARRAR
ncbi:MAG: tripartite tricarboxylate transporter substrate-binding protein [Gemmatimonadota bacterium]|jgi:tripartite-type tricarboxylate transporter receptor subunit TctC